MGQSLLSIAATAELLGKTQRQVRYLLKTGRIKAHKVSGKWRIAAGDLPLTEAQRQGLSDRAETVVQAATEAVEPVRKAASGDEDRKRFSVTDLRAWKQGEPLYRRAAAQLGREHSATTRLRACLEALAQGCHAYGAHDKQARYGEARDMASKAVVELLLGDEDEATRVDLATAIEQELLGPIVDLLRSE